MSTLHTTRTALRIIATLAVAPFIGLAFIVMLPVAGLGALAFCAIRAVVRQTRPSGAVRDVALFVAAPFVGLVYVLAMPVVGLITLAWIAMKSAKGAATASPVPAQALRTA